MTKIKVVFGINRLRDIDVELKKFQEPSFQVIPNQRQNKTTDNQLNKFEIKETTDTHMSSTGISLKI